MFDPFKRFIHGDSMCKCVCVVYIWVCLHFTFDSFIWIFNFFLFAVSQFNNLEQSQLNKNDNMKEKRIVLFVTSSIFLVFIRVCHWSIPFSLWSRASSCKFFFIVDYNYLVFLVRIVALMSRGMVYGSFYEFIKE